MSSANDTASHTASPNAEKKSSATDSSVINKSQSGIQSLEIGLSILEVLIRHNRPMMLKDIAQVMQIHPAKAHRYLVSLIRKDYANQLNDGRYGLGSRANVLGHNSQHQDTLLPRVISAAKEIKNRLNCGVQIAKWFSEGPVVIHSFEPDSPISIITRIGSRMPLVSSATGRLFASYQPSAIIEPLVLAEWQDKSFGFNNSSEANNKKADAKLARQWQAFTELQASIRQQGYATVSGDMLMGINAISLPAAIPLATDDEQLEYAITVIGTAAQLPLDNGSLIEEILAIAQRYQLA